MHPLLITTCGLVASPQVLKGKFDDIFAATKYTKALEAFRKLKADKAQELKVGGGQAALPPLAAPPP